MTNSIDFPPEENYPPSIVSEATAAHPLNQIIKVDVDTGDGLVDDVLALDVIIRDVNVTQPLQYAILIDGDVYEDRRIAPQAGFERNHAFSIDISSNMTGQLLAPGKCYRIELAVSGGFDSVSDLRPEIEDDLDIAVWWLQLVSTTEPVVNMDSCPQ